MNARLTQTPHTETVIITYELRGKGVEGDPYRRILTVWTLDGERIAEAKDAEWDRAPR